MSTAHAPRHSALPTTPRSSYSVSGTPRSAARRILTSGTPSLRQSLHSASAAASTSAAPLQPLPPIVSRTYSEKSYAEDDDLRELIAADRSAVDDAVSLMSSSLETYKTALLESLEEIGAERKRLEKMTRELGDAAREMVKTVQREKEEMDKARELEGEVQTRGRSLGIQVETAQAEVREIQSKLEARRDLKAKQRAAFAKQINRNSVELSFFEEKLGLRIRGKARDVVSFKFHNIDPASFPRTFSFDLDASSPTYSLPSLSPSSFLPQTVTQPLLDKLNQSRDLYAFVKSMRRAFVDEVGLEKRSWASEAEREKERRRARERREREEGL
ncbi:kinetochore-associated Ndc80 complex subunit spc25 [Rhodotorula toruloides]